MPNSYPLLQTVTSDSTSDSGYIICRPENTYPIYTDSTSDSGYIICRPEDTYPIYTYPPIEEIEKSKLSLSELINEKTNLMALLDEIKLYKKKIINLETEIIIMGKEINFLRERVKENAHGIMDLEIKE